MAAYGGWHRASGPWGRRGVSRCASPHHPPPPAAAAKIQNDLRILTERLARINDNLARKISSRNEYDKTIQETEAAYAKVRPPCAAPPIQHGRSTCLACGRASTCTTAAATAPGGGRLRASGCACARACRSRTAHPGYPCYMADHGELANAAARAQAGERQPHEEEAGVVVGGSASVRFWLGRCGADSLVSIPLASARVISSVRVVLRVAVPRVCRARGS
jgi:hypothetical protein